jgi:Protein of unknown function N-terminus (DUF3323)
MVRAELPADGSSLSTFADRTCDDTHALDDGTRLSGLVLLALAVLRDDVTTGQVFVPKMVAPVGVAAGTVPARHRPDLRRDGGDHSDQTLDALLGPDVAHASGSA